MGEPVPTPSIDETPEPIIALTKGSLDDTLDKVHAVSIHQLQSSRLAETIRSVGLGPRNHEETKNANSFSLLLEITYNPSSNSLLFPYLFL